MSVFKRIEKGPILLLSVALLVRLFLLPWSQVVHADAVSRVFIAVDWLRDPHYIDHGYWGPLHHYLNALAVWAFQGRVIGPKLLHILMATVSVIPLYYFTRNVFNRKGAFYAGLIFALCPILIRNSFQPLAGVPYAFFVLWAMYFISEAGRRDWPFSFAAFAGLSMTLAGALRYEAWVLIALFTLLLLLFRVWRFTVFFWAFSMIFPATWMIGNQLAYGDFLYSVNMNDVWNLHMEGVNDGVELEDRIQRVLFFPVSFVLNSSPIVSAMIGIGVIHALIRREMTREQMVWGIPFLGIAGIFLYKAWEGTLMLQHRFIISWVLLLLPFFALLFRKPVRWYVSGLTWIAVLSLVPLSFAWSFINYKSILGDNPVGNAVDRMALRTFEQVEAIPMIRDQRTIELLEWLKEHAGPADGLILDHMGWHNSTYLSFHYRNPAHLVPRAQHQNIDKSELTAYIQRDPKGFLVLSSTGKLGRIARMKDHSLTFTDLDLLLKVEKKVQYKGWRVFRYEWKGKRNAGAVREESGWSPVFGQEKDLTRIELEIRQNRKWYNKIRRSAFWKGKPVDSLVLENARYFMKTTD